MEAEVAFFNAERGLLSIKSFDERALFGIIAVVVVSLSCACALRRVILSKRNFIWLA